MDEEALHRKLDRILDSITEIKVQAATNQTKVTQLETSHAQLSTTVEEHKGLIQRLQGGHKALAIIGSAIVTIIGLVAAVAKAFN